jgi:hypothetical protein
VESASRDGDKNQHVANVVGAHRVQPCQVDCDEKAECRREDQAIENAGNVSAQQGVTHHETGKNAATGRA